MNSFCKIDNFAPNNFICNFFYRCVQNCQTGPEAMTGQSRLWAVIAVMWLGRSGWLGVSSSSLGPPPHWVLLLIGSSSLSLPYWVLLLIGSSSLGPPTHSEKYVIQRETGQELHNIRPARIRGSTDQFYNSDLTITQARTICWLVVYIATQTSHWWPRELLPPRPDPENVCNQLAAQGGNLK